MGRHRLGCGKDFPCPNGIHNSSGANVGAMAISTDGIIGDSIEAMEACLAFLKQQKAAAPAEPALPIVHHTKTQAQVQIVAPDGMCHHRFHGTNFVPGKYFPGLGISPCDNHQPPIPPFEAMTFRQADVFSNDWHKWLHSF